MVARPCQSHVKQNLLKEHLVLLWAHTKVLDSEARCSSLTLIYAQNNSTALTWCSLRSWALITSVLEIDVLFWIVILDIEMANVTPNCAAFLPTTFNSMSTKSMVKRFLHSIINGKYHQPHRWTRMVCLHLPNLRKGARICQRWQAPCSIVRNEKKRKNHKVQNQIDSDFLLLCALRLAASRKEITGRTGVPLPGLPPSTTPSARLIVRCSRSCELWLLA